MIIAYAPTAIAWCILVACMIGTYYAVHINAREDARLKVLMRIAQSCADSAVGAITISEREYNRDPEAWMRVSAIRGVVIVDNDCAPMISLEPKPDESNRGDA